MSEALLDLAAAGKMPMRTAKTLVRDGKFTLGDLAKLTPWHLTVIPNLGPKERQSIRDTLAGHGYDIARLEEPRPKG